jgi:hypothetical protein
MVALMVDLRLLAEPRDAMCEEHRAQMRNQGWAPSLRVVLLEMVARGLRKAVPWGEGISDIL